MSFQPNPVLSIALPTYNRADFLDSSLAAHLPILRRHNIQIFISDNASTDETFKIVEKWKAEYPLLHYSRNHENLGADLNFEKALSLSDTAYTWLLGDTSQFCADDLDKVLNLLKTNIPYDAVLVNLVNKIETPEATYQDANALLEDLAGLMSCMSCLIYSKALINDADFSRYHNSNFIQTGILFESIANRPFQIHWLPQASVTSLESPHLTKTSWAHTDKIFKIGLTCWVNFIFSLPVSYSLKGKLKACTRFGEVSGAFTIKGMLSLRARGLLNYGVYKAYRTDLRLSVGYPSWIVMVISVIPRSMLNKAVNLYLKRARTLPVADH
ncbi:glycosyltransferase [Pseudomonas sp. MYb541]|uniref:glycosyltransferase family 2 protein n=1 Tax=Pseudomonas sp. MYb541 TaxID=2745402 RepID=UPI0030A4529B